MQQKSKHQYLQYFLGYWLLFENIFPLPQNPTFAKIDRGREGWTWNLVKQKYHLHKELLFEVFFHPPKIICCWN